MRRTLIATAVVIGLACLATAGCGKPYNEHIDLIGTSALPALTDQPAQGQISGEPSLANGLDRRGWTMVTLGVPTHQVYHYPEYYEFVTVDNDREAWSPVYPTAEVALMYENKPGLDAADATVDVLYSAGMLVWGPFQGIFWRWPWLRENSPSKDYQVVPEHQAPDLWDWITWEGAPSGS